MKYSSSLGNLSFYEFTRILCQIKYDGKFSWYIWQICCPNKKRDNPLWNTRLSTIIIIIIINFSEKGNTQKAKRSVQGGPQYTTQI